MLYTYSRERVYHEVNPIMIDSGTPYKCRLLEFWNAFSLTSSVIKSISDNIYTQNKSIYFKKNKYMWYLPTIIVPLGYLEEVDRKTCFKCHIICTTISKLILEQRITGNIKKLHSSMNLE